MLAQHLAQQVVVRKRMTFGLREGFAESGSDAGSASGAPAAAAFEVLVNAVLLPQPFALAFVKTTWETNGES